MFPAVFFAAYILVTGAFAVMEDIFAYQAGSGQPFKMTVHGSLPHGLSRVLKVAYYLINRYVAVPQGLDIIENRLTLPGMVIFRTFSRHIDA
jgi:hypothetical protein